MPHEPDPSCRRANDPRVPLHAPATIEPAGAASLPLAGQLVNLSRGGLALHFCGVLDPGSAVRLTL